MIYDPCGFLRVAFRRSESQNYFNSNTKTLFAFPTNIYPSDTKAMMCKTAGNLAQNKVVAAS